MNRGHRPILPADSSGFRPDVKDGPAASLDEGASRRSHLARSLGMSTTIDLDHEAMRFDDQIHVERPYGHLLADRVALSSEALHQVAFLSADTNASPFASQGALFFGFERVMAAAASTSRRFDQCSRPVRILGNHQSGRSPSISPRPAVAAPSLVQAIEPNPHVGSDGHTAFAGQVTLVQRAVVDGSFLSSSHWAIVPNGSTAI